MSDSVNPVVTDQHKSLFQSFLQQYQAISGIVNSLPFHPNFKDKVIHYFDTGFLWAREAMNILQLAQNMLDESKPAEAPEVKLDVVDADQQAV